MAYLSIIRAYHQSLTDLDVAQQAWAEALEWLRDTYWQRYLFQAETELARWTRAQRHPGA
jgi:hypothetical protein